MTREEVYKMLNHTKLYVGKYSKEVQEKLFKLGYSWAGIKEIKYLDKPFIFIDSNNGKNLSWDDDLRLFRNHPYEEITFKDILDLKEEFLPFRNKQELLKGMSKHNPYGWIRNKSTDIVSQITSIQEYTLSIDCDRPTFTELFKYYEFLDGSACGIYLY